MDDLTEKGNNKSYSERKLAAIVFSDIKGYTAAMQLDESHALQLLETYRAVHEAMAREFNGDIIQYYGDACLIIFKSAYEAVKFAESIQLEFRKDPQVPVRVGIHLGDVVLRDDNVFGDSVNVASRVESLGVTGAVLFSETIFRSIKGHPDLKNKSLGYFDFKNVDEPIEIFALSNDGFPIPKPEEMHGKLKSFESSAKSVGDQEGGIRNFFDSAGKSLLQRTLFIITSLISLVVLSTIVWTFSKDFVETRFMAKNISNHEARVVVFNFENRTGDLTLDIIGEMTADRISHSISKNNIATVISNEVFNDYSSIVKMSAISGPDNLAVHKYLSADKMISGNYYKEDEKLIFEANVTNIEDGSIMVALDAMADSEDSALLAIKQLQESVMGFLATADSPELVLDTQYPKFEAYRHFLLSKEDETNQLFHLEQAIRIDSDYVEPRLFRVSYYYNNSEFEIADSLYNILKNRLVYADDRQRNLLSFYKALLEGKSDMVYTHWLREYSYSPFDFPTNLTAMVLALQFVNKPEDALDYYQDVPLDGLDMVSCRRCKVRAYLKAIAHSELGDYTKAIREYENLLSLEYDPFYFELLARAHARKGDWDEMDEILIRNTRISNDELPSLFLAIGKEALVSGKSEEKIQYFTKALNASNDSTTLSLRAEISYFLEDYPRAIELLEQALVSEDDIIETLGWLGASYAANGKLDLADQIAQQLSKMDGAYTFGSVQYALARISLARGDEGSSLSRLKSAVSRGIRFRGVTFQNDAFFYEIFEKEEFIRILNYWK